MIFDLIATTAFGIESITARELENLGFTDLKVENGRITFKGDERDIARCNIHLRTADRILIKMAEFKAVTFEELFQGVKAIPWGEFLPIDAEMHVIGRSVRSGLFSVPDCQAITKKAIVEKMKEKYNISIFEETGPKYKIEVALLKDIVTITIDTTGPGLNKRGYRRIAGEAPLKETMACALLLLTYWKRGRFLIDPLCGSGTIPIEAAMIAKNMAPGVNRSFVAETWRDFDEKIWDDVRNEARAAEIKDVPRTIFGSDLDPKAVELAIHHAKEAGVGNIAGFKQMNVLDFYSKEKYGFIVTNPPYGERIGEMRAVERLYGDLGKVYRRLDSWSFYLITSHPSFEKLFGRTADKRRKLYNGQLLCQYYQFLGPKPPKDERNTIVLSEK
ncbi:MAG: class I SAM-dependent RNA methyltransferase [Ruminococcaceae bacterium]|nr:class I SAM-dependent RNA methyltransferase [Oscillospiraceae bacterium]